MHKFLVIGICLLLVACKSTNEETVEQHQYTNDLVDETSPYLLQHAHNPVNWKPWKPETLKEAEESNKLMIVSIGYAACHWCHVMEHESFEDSTVAAVMNKHFIAVKVDREERPDVDQVYINAVQLMTGNAGWPLNVITLPDGRPVWGGTYFKKDDWIQAISQVQELYQEEPQKLIDYASKLEEGIKSIDLVELNTDEVDFANFDSSDIVQKFKQNFDTVYGGSRGAPKFMMPTNLEYLFREGVKTNDQVVIGQVMLSLDKMAYGGIYDAIGGGFSRYSVDKRWHVPHFEKMLYDNAQLVSLYSLAYKVNPKPLYKEVVYQTLEFIARDLTNELGAFYSSLDADSKAADGSLEEGAYYIYNEAELKEVIGSDFELFQSYFNINSFGKWENDHFVLIRTESDATIADQFNISEATLKDKKDRWRTNLREHRNQRPHPRLDDKSLTSWNALMLKGYVDAYKTFEEPSFLEAALKNATFISNTQLQKDGRLFHSYKDGKSTINGYLEDYAAVIEAYLSLYEVTLDSRWLNLSKKMADYTFLKFHDEQTGMFYFTSSEDDKMMTRNFEYRDNVIPASNSIMASNLELLSHHFDSPKYRETARQMLKNIQKELKTYPSAFGNWLQLLANYQDKFYEIVVVGEDAPDKITAINKMYLPNAMIAGSKKAEDLPLLKGRHVAGKTFIYVCVNNTCKLPVQEVEDAIKLMMP